MKKSLLYLFLIGVLLLSAMVQAAVAQKTISVQSGNYSDANTWNTGVPPDGGDIVISSGHTVTLDVPGKFVLTMEIEEGATFDNGSFDFAIDKWFANSGAEYKNDGVHNSSGGKLILFEKYFTRVSGSGITNCDLVNIDYGIQPVSGCNLTINGDLIQSNSPTSMSPQLFWFDFGQTITINGNIIMGSVVAKNIINGTPPYEPGTLIVNGNVSLPASGSIIENHGTIQISGNLTLGPDFSFADNYNQMEIGGDILGAGEWSSFIVNNSGALLKLGGEVFPTSQGGNFMVASNSSVEYNGNTNQTIFRPWNESFEDGPYYNLIISNINAVASITSTIEVSNNLTIKPGAALSHSSGTFTVNGTFTIESDATGTGSFISNNTYNGNVERYIAGHNNAGPAAGWHLLSSPVANQAISAFHTPALGGDDFFKWSDADGLWINRTTETGNLNPGFEANFASGTGYLTAFESTDTKTFSGNINTSNVNISGLSADNGGWHLLGNPFSSAILWNDGNWTLNNVDGIAQVWNEANASYSTVEANDAIPSMNGFFVRASQAGASITIPAAARAHSGQSWYKESQSTNRIVLKAIDHQNNTAQPTVIRYNEQATEGYDNAFDSYFLSGYAPQLYSLDGQNNQYALNTLPVFDPQQQIPLGFEKNQSDNFTLSLVENTVTQEVYLTDKHTQQTVNLSQGSYSFTASGNDLDRFSLHFALVGIEEGITDKPALHVWYANGQLYLNNVAQGELTLYNILGQPVLQTTVQATTHTSHQLSLKPGVYVVQLRSNTGAATAKINIQ